jgi:hypothetical protein
MADELTQKDGYKLPQPPEKHLVPNEYTAEKFRQQPPPKAPVRAIKIKGDQLRAAVRNGKQLDWADIHERFVDLWQEGRMCVWRAKHSKSALKVWDPHLQQHVQSFTVDEKLVLSALDTLRGILDSIVKVRREMGHDASGIPRWAIERIERALRNHPEAMSELLKELAAEDEKLAEKID